MNTMKIAWLFPDTLYLHGERGNILALARFAELAGFQAQIEKVDFETENFDAMDYDVIFCPPGEIASYPTILDWLKPYKELFQNFVEAGRPMVVTGTSIALWGSKVVRTDGSEFEGMGLVEVEARENEAVYGDDIYFSCSYHGAEMEIIGNQIQMADFINQGEEPFGKLIYGYGNTGKNREEGFQKKNAIFTNTLAPMLVVSPKLTMEIIKAAAESKGLPIENIQFDMELEEKSFATKKEFIFGKESRLTNCKEKE